MVRSLKTLSRCLHISSSQHARIRPSGKLPQPDQNPTQSIVGGDQGSTSEGDVRLKKVEHGTTRRGKFVNVSRAEWPSTEQGKKASPVEALGKRLTAREEARKSWSQYRRVRALQPTTGNRMIILRHPVRHKLIGKVPYDTTNMKSQPLNAPASPHNIHTGLLKPLLPKDTEMSPITSIPTPVNIAVEDGHHVEEEEGKSQASSLWISSDANGMKTVNQLPSQHMKIRLMPYEPIAEDLASQNEDRRTQRRPPSARHIVGSTNDERSGQPNAFVPMKMRLIPQEYSSGNLALNRARAEPRHLQRARHIGAPTSRERAAEENAADASGYKQRQQDLLSEIFDELLRSEATRQPLEPKAERFVPRLAFDTDLSAPHRDVASIDERAQEEIGEEGGVNPEPELAQPLEAEPAAEREDYTIFRDADSVKRFYREPPVEMNENAANRSLEMKQDIDFRDLDSVWGQSGVDTAVEWLKEAEEAQDRKVEPDLEVRQEMGLLVLRSASKLLDRSDFTSLEPTAKHIVGWSKQGKILNIIRGRDDNTLARNGDYYLLFESQSSAEAYLDRVSKIHRFAHSFARSDLESPLPPQPSAYDISHPGRMLNAFALALPTHALNMTLKPQPWPPLLRSILEQSGYEALVRGRLSRHEALLAVEGALLHKHTVRKCIELDGQHRRIEWAIVGGPSAVRSFELNSPSLRNGEYQNGIGGELAPGDHGPLDPSPEYLHRRFVVSFATEAEALRFVMSWHRRDIKHLIEAFTGERAVVSAELTW